VSNRTFRSLDEPPKLLGFTLGQWGSLITGTAVLLAVVYALHIPVKPAITLGVFLIGLPAAMTYVSETGGLQLWMLLRSAGAWRFSRKTLAPSAAGDRLPRTLVIAAGRQNTVACPDPGVVVGEEDMGYWERWHQ
jgi:hypothetical protein